MKDVNDKLGRYIIDELEAEAEEQELSEAEEAPRIRKRDIIKGIITNKDVIRTIKDVLMIIQAIHDLRSSKVPKREKVKMVEQYIESLNYVLRGKKLPDYYKDMIVCGVMTSMKHANVSLKAGDFDFEF